MRTIRKAIIAILLLAVVLAASGTLAGAVKSYNGDDYSEDFDGSYIETCDMESDETKVKSQADDDNVGSGSDAAKDVDGNNGICGTANMGWSIYRHRTCEYRSLWPDACGNWQAT